MEVVGVINFDGYTLDVYRDLDEPLFLAVQVAKLIDYSNGKTEHMLELIEEDEKILVDFSDGLTRQQRRTLEREAKKSGQWARKAGSLTSKSDSSRSIVTSIGQKGNQKKWFVTELGLYNVLSQSRKPVARKWRRVVHSKLILLRKQKEMDVVEQFDEWHTELDDLYICEETGRLMRTITLAGGDTDQIPYEDS